MASRSKTDPRSELVSLLTDLLDRYSAQRRTPNAWESHCLARAITLLRFGDFDQARRKVIAILQPPTALPTFPMPRRVTLDDVRHALSLLSSREG